ncbi:flavin-based extracellular electron transfer system protein EetA, partial [Escherichia coli]|nr:flavin-based extracellular electron transfer system protein EetA [Escherichia coli]
VCVRTGAIDKQGDTVVCLPHKLVIEVKASDGSSGDSDDPIISS